jgi:hypothetical protein
MYKSFVVPIFMWIGGFFMTATTITRLALGSTTGHVSQSYARLPYMVETLIDIADWRALKGSALEVGDIVQAINVPAETLILGGGVEVIAIGAPATVCTIDFGKTGDLDFIVDGGDIIAGVGYLAIGTNGLQFEANRVTAAATIDAKIITLTGVLSTGKLRVYAILLDISGKQEVSTYRA